MKIPDPLEQPTIKAPVVAEIWDCSLWKLYEMVKDGTAPVPPIKVGRALRWPTLPVLRSVGLAPDAGTTEALDAPNLKVVNQ